MVWVGIHSLCGLGWNPLSTWFVVWVGIHTLCVSWVGIHTLRGLGWNPHSACLELESTLSTWFGLESTLSAWFGLESTFSTWFGLESTLSTWLGLESTLSTWLGLESTLFFRGLFCVVWVGIYTLFLWVLVRGLGWTPHFICQCEWLQSAFVLRGFCRLVWLETQTSSVRSLTSSGG